MTNQEAPLAFHEQGLALAARRIFTSLSSAEILLQLCREAVLLTGCTRALGSYLSTHQPWSNGVHVQLIDATTVPLSTAQRSAVYAVYRQLARDGDPKAFKNTPDTGAIFRGLTMDGHVPSAICAVPIHGRRGRIAGALLIVDNACAQAEHEVLQSLILLCDCASAALENAQRFAMARRHQERLFVFSEATEEALWDLDLDTDEVWWGGAVETLYRGPAIEIGQTLAWKEQRIHSAERERVRATFVQALGSTEPRWQEIYRFERADGTFATVEDRAHLLRDINGNPRRVVGRLRDITELLELHRRETEAIRAREQSEERLRLAIEAASLGTWDIDLISHQRVANDLYYDLVGIPRGCRLIVDGFALVHPEDRARVREATERAMSPESEGIFDVECRFTRPADGHERWVKTRGRVHFDASSKPVRFIGTLFDISKRKYAEQQLQLLADAGERLARSLDSKSTLSEIAELAIQGFADWCCVEAFTDGDTALETAIAHADPERVRFVKQLKDEYPPDKIPPWGSRRVIHTGRLEFYSDITEVLIQEWEDSEQKPSVARVLGIRSVLTVPMIARGRVAGAISLAMAESGRRFSPADIPFVEELARRAALAVENARLYHQAQEAVRLRDEFLSIASHELKTPLTPLRLQLDNLKRSLAKEGLLDERVAARLEQASRQTQRLTTLVDSLLDVSRISAGRLSLELEDAEFGDIVTDVVQRFADEARVARAPLELQIEHRVPGQWDRLRIEQVLANLISNAIKYGAGKPISIRVAMVDHEVRVDVQDAGIGIAPEDTARIFARFERAASMRHFGGLGLGLYIAQQIVEAHGGTIGVRSTLEQGSTFTVALPLKPIENGQRMSNGTSI